MWEMFIKEPIGPKDVETLRVVLSNITTPNQNAKVEMTMTNVCDERRIENAVISSADILTDPCLNFWLSLDYGGSCQGFGGYRLGGDFGCLAIERLLEVVGVGRWSQLAGRPVRVEHTHERISRIGNYLKDEWLDLKALAEFVRKEKT